MTWGPAKALRSALGPLALVLAAIALLAAPVGAQSLRRLHVDALSMRVDHVHPHVGQVFHLAIHVRVSENVQSLDELVIPDLGTLQSLGDERQVTHGPAGTDVVERLTLEPTLPGPFTLQPAYLDVIDARTGRPSRFSANPVRIVVEGAPVLDTFAARLLRAIARAALIVLGLVLALFVVVGLVRRLRGRERTRVIAKPAPAPPPLPPTPRDAVAEALRGYRLNPSAPHLFALRAALFAAAGVSKGATLRDSLAATSDHALRAALLAAERSAFGPASTRDEASSELIGATEAWLR